MAKLEFEYDETGDKFLYFLVSLGSILILPLTYALWPSSSPDDDYDTGDSVEQALYDHYEPLKAKISVLKRDFGQKRLWHWRFRSASIAVTWLVFAGLVFAAFRTGRQASSAGSAYDPYSILEVDPEASDNEIKSAYRKLAKLHHPDRGGDEATFRQISLAYKALTDNVTRYNWQKYGNPDGPGVVRFGIALPKWLVDERYSAFVLAGYIITLVIGLPSAVGVWWYRSGRYALDTGGILLGTSRLYWQMIMHSPSMNIQRVFLVLSGSLEFQEEYGRGCIRERPSDNEDIPRLITRLSTASSCILGSVNERCREFPFFAPYSIKARTLLLAHVLRLDPLVGSPALLDEQRYVIRESLKLIAEMVQIAANVSVLAQAGQLPARNLCKTDTIETIMRMSPLIVQALRRPDPFLQLPFMGAARAPHSELDGLAKMDDSLRRKHFLHPKSKITDEQYETMVLALGTLPRMELAVMGRLDRVRAGLPFSIFVQITRKTLGSEEKTELSQEVFCPFYPARKKEGWWLYVVSKRSRDLLSPIHFVSGGDAECVVEVRVRIPETTGAGPFAVDIWLRSDSYVGLDVVLPIKIGLTDADQEEDEGNDEETLSEDDLDDDDDVESEESDESDEQVYTTESDEN